MMRSLHEVIFQMKMQARDTLDSEYAVLVDECLHYLGEVKVDKPVGWFNHSNEYHGYQQVSKEHEGAGGTIPLYARPAALASRDVTEEPVAWMVTGGRTFKDSVWATKIGAQGILDQRKDGSVLVPLYARPLPLPTEEKMREARNSALEEAADYHDDLAAQHDAVGYESSHHEMMVRKHRQFAAAIRALKAEGESL
jgi:hypothetical protein